MCPVCQEKIMQKGLVSVITPCFNTGKYIHKLLDSVVKQDYPSVEMIVIDDGSTDNTAEVVKSYIPIFQNRGYSLSYIYQENSGQSVAINNALKYVKGEFLVWPDSDDFYSSDEAISKLVDAIAGTNDEYSFARGQCYMMDENTGEEVKLYAADKQDQFEDCLFGNFLFCPGNYIIKTSILDERIPGRDIYTEKNAGQNWQMLLPILYGKKCITINEYIYTILSREDSHSRGMYKTYSQQCTKIRAYRNTIIGTLDRMTFMPHKQLDYYKKRINDKYDMELLKMGIQNGDYEQVKMIRNKLDSGLLSRKRKLAASFCWLPGWKYLLKLRLFLHRR